METQEVKQHKVDFVDYCSEVLTQSKNDRGKNLPDKRAKHRVLQAVIDDPEQAKRLDDREPTVEEYGTFIRGTVANKISL